MLDVMNSEFYKKNNHSCDLVAVSAGLRELCVSPSARWLWPPLWGPGRDKHTDDRTRTWEGYVLKRPKTRWTANQVPEPCKQLLCHCTTVRISSHLLSRSRWPPPRSSAETVLFNSSHLTRLLVEQVAPTNDTLVLRLYPEAGFEAVERHPVRIVFISAFAEEQGVVVQEEMSLHWLEPGHLLHSDRCSLMADPHIEASLQDHPTQLAEVTLRQRKHKQGGGTTLRVTALFTEDSFIFSHTRRVSRCKHIKDLKTSSLMVMLAFKFHTDWSHAAITLTRGWIWDKSAQLF